MINRAKREFFENKKGFLTFLFVFCCGLKYFVLFCSIMSDVMLLLTLIPRSLGPED